MQTLSARTENNASSYRLSRFLGEFADRATESRYRRYVQPHAVRLLRRVLIVWGVIWSAFGFADYQAFGLGPLFATLLVLRVGFVGLLVVVGLLVRRRPAEATGGRLMTLVATVAFSQLFVFLSVSADPAVGWMVAINMVFIIVLFVLVPNRTVFSAAVALYGIIGTIFSVAGTLEDTSPVGLTALAAMLIAPAVAGWFAAQRFEISRRHEFAALEQAEAEIDRRRELEAELTRQARTDALTGASNRHHYEAAFAQEYRHARRYDRPLSLCILDIDHFKRINDTYGHTAGDAALIELARTCREEMRGADILGRLGGEEFVLILPETPQQYAVDLAERLCSRLAEMKIVCKKESFGITVTMGVATLTVEDAGIDDLLQRADAALYEGKAAGRNRVAAA